MTYPSNSGGIIRDLKAIVTEARPLIEQQLELTERIAGLREAATAKGLDWSQIKALLKAQIADENDESGDGKRVKQLLAKAEHATDYAALLGLNMNENNFIPADEAEDQSTAARKDVQQQPARRSDEPDEGYKPNLDRSDANPQGGDVAPDTRQPAAGTQAPPIDTHPRNSKGIRKPDGCQQIDMCRVAGWRQRCNICEAAFVKAHAQSEAA